MESSGDLAHGPDAPLVAELAYFNRHRAGWIAGGHLGEWVAVKGEDLLGFFPDLSPAYLAGAERFGPGPFLVKRVQEKDDIAIIKRTSRFARTR